MTRGPGKVPPTWTVPPRQPAVPARPKAPRAAKAVEKQEPGWLRTGAARGVAFFLGTFTLLNLAAELHSHFDANQWWIGFDPLPGIVRKLVLLAAAVMLLCYAVMPRCSPERRRVTMSLIEVLFIVLAWNIVNFYAGRPRQVEYAHAGAVLAAGLVVAAAGLAGGVTPLAGGQRVTGPGDGGRELGGLRGVVSTDADALLRAERL